MTITNVLAAVDFSAASRAACNAAIAYARRYGASLHIVHVVQEPSAPGFETAQRASLAAFVDEASAPDGTRGILLRSPRPAEALLEYADAASVDLIVLGTHGQSGLDDLFMGSVAQQVLRRSHCPVLTLRRPHAGPTSPSASESQPARSG